MRLLTPLAKVRGLGAAHSGTHHWVAQRLTAIAMLPLAFWLVFTLMKLSSMKLEVVTAWMQSPLNALLFSAFLIAMFYHAKLGMQVIIEDYIHAPAVKYSLLIINRLGFTLLGLMSLMAVLKLHGM